MGKASRTKREARAASASRSAPPPEETRRSLPVFWLVIAAMVVAGIAALVLTAPDEKEQARDAAAAKIPVYADVVTEGDPLPTWTGSDTDDAVGMTVPGLRGEKFDGFRTSLAPGDGTARVYVALAHWCPHCQAEVPRIVKWAKAHDLPENVEIVAVSTAVDKGRPNFPPAAWLADEQWPYDVLIDDEVGSAGEALGIEGFPFLVFTDADGTVTRRYSGEMPIDEFDAEVRAIAPEAAGAQKAA